MFSHLKNLFQKSGQKLGSKIRALFSGKIDETTLEKLEEVLFEADLGVELVTELTEKAKAIYKKNNNLSADQILKELESHLIADLQLPSVAHPKAFPHIILIVGTNGSGKTTSIAKLAHLYKKQGHEVLIAAGDTFRAAAIPQLNTWAQRAGVEIVKGKEGGDPAAVAFDAIQAAAARHKGVVLIDTAGRLHTKTDLMGELQKIKKVCQKAQEGAPHETFLVLDATLGQNALLQAETFQKYTPLSGIILTKLDGTAKGGTAVAIQKKLSIPIKYIGVGETIDALHEFDLSTFVKSLLS